MHDDHIILKFRELQSMFRLPGFIRTETLMDFWGCNRSLVSRRLKIMDHRRLAIIRSEHMGDGRRWYWIDPYLPDAMDPASIRPPKQPRISVTLPPAAMDRCRAHCKAMGLPMATWVAGLIQQELDASAKASLVPPTGFS
jgi:hypothetical protein